MWRHLILRGYLSRLHHIESQSSHISPLNLRSLRSRRFYGSECFICVFRSSYGTLAWLVSCSCAPPPSLSLSLCVSVETAEPASVDPPGSWALNEYLWRSFPLKGPPGRCLCLFFPVSWATPVMLTYCHISALMHCIGLRHWWNGEGHARRAIAVSRPSAEVPQVKLSEQGVL